MLIIYWSCSGANRELFILLVVCLMVLSATFNNISVISWRSVLFVEETGENHRPVASYWQTLSHNLLRLALIEIRTHNINGDRNYCNCIGSCKSNYHTIMATTAPSHHLGCVQYINWEVIDYMYLNSTNQAGSRDPVKKALQ